MNPCISCGGDRSKPAPFTCLHPANHNKVAPHNHPTRDIKPYGKCPGCDEYHDRNTGS